MMSTPLQNSSRLAPIKKTNINSVGQGDLLDNGGRNGVYADNVFVSAFQRKDLYL